MSLEAFVHLLEQWFIGKTWQQRWRDMKVRHARERAEFTRWRIEVEHYLKEQGDG